MKPVDHIFLHLNIIPGIGPSTIQALIQHKPADVSWESIYHFFPSDFQQIFGLSAAIAQHIVQGLRDHESFKKELHLLEHHACSWISILNPQYPQALKEIAHPPIGLYVRGSLMQDYMSSLAIVGSRNGDRYGQRIIHAFVPTLVKCGWSIVSGGALGIDTMAHQAALDADGHTTVVLGSGLLSPYPRSNISLFNQIISSNGTIISSFPLQMQPKAGNFPARNRIIAGITRGCMVVQAAERSGARITANFALEQGREVFAIPGSFDHPLSSGCHALIQDGAMLVTKPEDIFAAFGQQVIPSSNKKQTISSHVSEKLDSSFINLPTVDQHTHPLVRACSQPISINDLIEATGMSLQTLQQELFQLQLNGEIKQDFTGLWSQV